MFKTNFKILHTCFIFPPYHFHIFQSLKKSEKNNKTHQHKIYMYSYSYLLPKVCMLYMRPVHNPCNYPVYQHNLNGIFQAFINDIYICNFTVLLLQKTRNLYLSNKIFVCNFRNWILRSGGMVVVCESTLMSCSAEAGNVIK